MPMKHWQISGHRGSNSLPMLAHSANHQAQSGALGKNVHLKATSMHELLDFIADQLPGWRDDPDRPKKTSETDLTSQLCGYLNTAARFSSGWDILQFRIEEPDEQQKGRKIDLVASPCGPRSGSRGDAAPSSTPCFRLNASGCQRRKVKTVTSVNTS